MQRRQFLELWTLAAGALALGACGGGKDDETYLEGTQFFPQSVASGDPRPDAVVLWTRVVDEDAGEGDLELEVQVSSSEDFADYVAMEVTARADRDRTVRVQATELEAGQFYFYRFVYRRADGAFVSRTGRTKTAPSPDADTPVRFAFVSCQDFNGRWYNNYLAMLEQELDFVVHLGDYIYETTGDPSFQIESEERSMRFVDEAGAIVFNAGSEDEYFAAKSLSNYRQLYQVYRGDAALQAVHERFPMLVIWDDHEFSNDCHGANGTYFGGAVDEEDFDRRKAANQAWFEYMPVAYRAGAEFEFDPAASFPGDLDIYRSFRFGQHLELFLTDARSYRSDHPVPEGALPGTVGATEAELMAALGEIPAAANPYVADIDALDGGSYAQAIRDGADTLGIDAGLVTGAISARWIDAMITELGAALPAVDTSGLPRGIAFVDCGKSSQYSSFGSRSLVVKPALDAYMAARFEATGGESEQVLGPDQEAWFFDAVESSEATWKVWGNEFPLNQYAVDLSALGGIPAEFAQLFYLTIDQWEGQRNRRSAVIERLAQTPNVVAITGDIHAFGVGTPTNHDASAKIPELTTSSVSSGNFREELFSTIASSDSLSEFSSATTLASAVDDILAFGTNPYLAWTESTQHGFAVVEVAAGELSCTMQILPEEFIKADYADRLGELRGAYTQERFRVLAGSPEVEREIDGTWRRWDPAARQWV